jgi:hypothetical protein
VLVAEVPAVEVPAVEVLAVEVPAVEVPAVEVPAVEVLAVGASSHLPKMGDGDHRTRSSTRPHAVARSSEALAKVAKIAPDRRILRRRTRTSAQHTADTMAAVRADVPEWRSCRAMRATSWPRLRTSLLRARSARSVSSRRRRSE